MTTIRRIPTSKIDGNSSNSTTADEIRPYGEIAVYINTDDDQDNKLELLIFDGERTHLKSKVLSKGTFYGGDADSGDGEGLDTIKLVPDAELYRDDSDYDNDQYLIIDPTGGEPNHIHIRAGGTIDSSSTDLFLGGERNNIRVSDTNDRVTISTDAGEGGTPTWTFDNSGSLTLPIGATNNGRISNINGISLAVDTSFWTFDGDGGLTFPDTTTQTTAYTGYHNGDMTGSVFADDSTLLVDAVSGTIPGILTGDWYDPQGSFNISAAVFSVIINRSNLSVGSGYATLLTDNIYLQGSENVTIQSPSSIEFISPSITLTGDIRSESAINIDINLTDSTLRRWQFGEDGKFIVPGDIVGYQTYVSENPADERVTIQPSGSVDKPFLFTTDQTNGTWERSSMELPSAEINKAVSLGFPHNNITTGYIYNQGTDTLSGTEFNNAFNIMANSTDVKISTVSGGGNKVWKFAQDGDITLPASGDVLDSTGVGQLANRVEGSWTVTAGTNTYSFTLPSDGTYVMWVKGNIPNGIITWNATASVSNTNVPAIGTQYAWNYTGGGSPISLTSIPDQIKGVAGTISTDATYVGTTSNRFDFGINNTSGASQIVYYGYTKI